jgi:hypothetical protein
MLRNKGQPVLPCTGVRAPISPLTPAVLLQYEHHFSAGLKGGRKETKNRILGFLFLTAFYCWLNDLTNVLHRSVEITAISGRSHG